MGSVPKNNFALYLESDKGFLTLVKRTLVETTRPSTDIKQKGLAVLETDLFLKLTILLFRSYITKLGILVANRANC